jgi:hypothetical protein
VLGSLCAVLSERQRDTEIASAIVAKAIMRLH